ncbi:putative fluoride ion transporter CrcB [Bacteroidia bacterium]|nr:putative fluoride ion transporter CrcB [Bacteroidia bacterium]
MLKQILLVGLGGGAGSIFRFLTSHWIAKTGHSFPFATLIINLLGCLFIGILMGLWLKNQIDTNLRILLVAGFCGGFTTFSTFSLENLQMYQAGQYVQLIVYTLVSVLLGFLAVWIGFAFTK